MKPPSNFWHWCGEAALFVVFVILPALVILSFALVNPMTTAEVTMRGPGNAIIERCNADAIRGYWPAYCR